MGRTETTADKTLLLGTAPVAPLFFRLALPAVLVQLVGIANNVIDRVWVGHVPGAGAHALEAVGVCLPIQYVVIALVMVLVAGVGPTVSCLLGEGRRDEASRVSGACFGISILVSVSASALLVVLAPRLVRLFGAAGAAEASATAYLRTIAAGLPFSNLLLLLTAWLGAQGYVAEGVRLGFVSVAVNAVLDPLLIFPCGFGVVGAALATNAGAILALLLGVVLAVRDRRLLRIGLASFRPRTRLWLPSALVGLATGINTALESLALMLINASLKRHGGDLAVAALSLYTVVGLTLVNVCLGLSMGAQPIVSYNFGRRDGRRVRAANRIFTLVSFGCSLALWAAVMLFPERVWGAFTSDRQLVAFATANTPLYFAFLLVTGVQYAQLYIVRFVKSVRLSLFLGIVKRLVLLLPLVFILPVLLPGNGTRAVLLASPITDLAAFLITAFCTHRLVSRLKSH